ncbi:hypothetical protein MesoLj131c_68760 (plasmid) [Mesorhizobium sp. 131-3-5]|nr:hypothetical protein MesoLj131c_68760 [Mesorhizobium sp. 131-3-5]
MNGRVDLPDSAGGGSAALDILFDIEREFNGLNAEGRACARRERSTPLMEDLHSWG